MTVDVAAFIGPYPFRDVPGHDPAGLVDAMDRVGIAEAWVGSLPAVFQETPGTANADLYRALTGHPRLRPVPTLWPAAPAWERDLGGARDAGAPAVRIYPDHHGIDPAGAEAGEVLAAAAEAGCAVVLTVRLEDVRQRDPRDVTPDLTAAAARQLARRDPRARLIVTHADRGFVEEVHFGLTPDEAARVWWDISWIWGPPEDHLALLCETIGPARFVFGTGMPLRLPESPVAKLDLLDLPPGGRAAIERGNVAAWGFAGGATGS